MTGIDHDRVERVAGVGRNRRTAAKQKSGGEQDGRGCTIGRGMKVDRANRVPGKGQAPQGGNFEWRERKALVFSAVALDGYHLIYA